MSRTRKSALTLAVTLTGAVVTTLLTFVTTPILLSLLGSTRFGVFYASLGWLGFVALFELGLSSAISAKLAGAVSRNDRVVITAVFRAGIRAYFVFAAISIAAAALVVVLLPWLTNTPTELTAELWKAAAVGQLSYLLLPLTPFRALADASQRGYVSASLLAVQSILTTLLSVGFAMLGFGLAGLFLAPVLASLPYYGVLAWDGLRRHPELVASRVTDGQEETRDREEHTRSLWALSWPSLASNLAGRLSVLSDPQILAIMLGPAVVTPFVLTQKALTLLGSQLGNIGNASWAGLLDLHYNGMRERFADRLFQLTRFTTLAGGAVLTPVAVWNQELTTLWVGAENYAGPLVTWLAAANTCALGVLALWGWPLMAGGFIRTTMRYLFVYTAVNVVTSIAATATAGIAGPLLGTTVSLFCVSLWWTPLLVSRNFGISYRSLLEAALRPALVVVGYAAALSLLTGRVNAYPPDVTTNVKWLCLLGWLAAGALGFLPFAWWIALPKSDRDEWGPRLKNSLLQTVAP